MTTFPDAKVILTVRDPERWYESTIETIYRGTVLSEWLLELLPPFKGMNKMIQATAWDRLFKGQFEERDIAISEYHHHVEDVKSYVPAEKLLVFNVKEGWKPLCDFLNAPLSDEPFPHINDRQMTKRMYLLARIGAVAIALVVLFFLIWILSLIF